MSDARRQIVVRENPKSAPRRWVIDSDDLPTAMEVGVLAGGPRPGLAIKGPGFSDAFIPGVVRVANAAGVDVVFRRAGEG